MTLTKSLRQRGRLAEHECLQSPSARHDALFSDILLMACDCILLAQMRQLARDKAHAEVDAKYRDASAVASSKHCAQTLELLRQNTELEEIRRTMAERIETLTVEIHRHPAQDTTRKDRDARMTSSPLSRPVVGRLFQTECNRRMPCAGARGMVGKPMLLRRVASNRTRMMTGVLTAWIRRRASA